MTDANGNLTPEEYAFLRRKQAEIDARKPPQSVRSVPGFKSFHDLRREIAAQLDKLMEEKDIA